MTSVAASFTKTLPLTFLLALVIVVGSELTDASAWVSLLGFLVAGAILGHVSGRILEQEHKHERG